MKNQLSIFNHWDEYTEILYLEALVKSYHYLAESKLDRNMGSLSSLLRLSSIILPGPSHPVQCQCSHYDVNVAMQIPKTLIIKFIRAFQPLYK